ncbi:Maf family protein [Planctomycetes bacterium K23_9]
MNGLPRADLPTDEPLVLASGSPRRAELLKSAGYQFRIDPASDNAECGICSGDAAPEFSARNAFRKAEDVAGRYESALVIGADTVAWCNGQILGKPRDVDHAESILRMLSGRSHDVYTGICVWSVKLGKVVVEAVRTELQMLAISDAMLEEHLDSMRWEGKAGAFGFQDGNDWLKITGDGSASNVVGLPMERLKEILEKFDSIADPL